MMNNIPDSVLEALPYLKGKAPTMRLASRVPIIPDTTFDIFITDNEDYLALVTTDYADPYEQSRELKSISGHYEFEFTHLLKPFEDNTTIEILPHDDMNGDFFVAVPYNNSQLYYYLANLKSGK